MLIGIFLKKLNLEVLLGEIFSFLKIKIFKIYIDEFIFLYQYGYSFSILKKIYFQGSNFILNIMNFNYKQRIFFRFLIFFN